MDKTKKNKKPNSYFNVFSLLKYHTLHPPGHFKYNNTTSSPRKGPLHQWGQSTYFKPLSLAAPFAPPCPTALGLIGPRKKEKKTGFDDVFWVRLDLGPPIESYC